MPKRDKYDDEDEDDEEESPFDFFKQFGDPSKFFSEPNKFFIDPNKLFKSKDFRKLFNEILNKMMDNLPPELQNLTPQELMKEFNKNKSKFGFFPVTYGFNINIGKDGRPTIDSFGNVKAKPYSGKPEVKSKREPLVEVNEEKEHFVVIAEMPGVDRDDIELKATSHSLTISTKENASMQYYKEVDFSNSINSDVAKARYVNGILEVRLKKLDEKHRNIRIE
jgi:HSP20 family protein